MRKGLMICGDRPDVRVGRLTESLYDHGWEHDVVCRTPPAQFAKHYRYINQIPYATRAEFVDAIRRSDAEVLHVHGELYDAWLMSVAKEGADGRKVIFNVHDLACHRLSAPFDPHEEEAFELADALVFVVPQQRDFAHTMGLNVDKPTAFVTNYPSKSIFIDETVCKRIGGVVYEGGIAPRGQDGGDRDLSPIADALHGQLHIYPGHAGVDYGIVYDMEFDYQLLIHRLAAHDWGFCGHPKPHPSWMQTFATKAGEYLAAGIPIIAINQPTLQPLADLGMCVQSKRLKDIRKTAKLDPAPYRKAVLEHRHKFTTQAVIGPLVQMYDEVGR